MTSLMADPLDFAQRHRLTIGLAAMLVLALAAAAYAAWPRQTAPTTTTTTTAAVASWSRICVAGVSYLQFTSGTSVEWTPAGKVKTCSEPAK
jgi:hypothetical protein